MPAPSSNAKVPCEFQPLLAALIAGVDDQQWRERLQEMETSPEHKLHLAVTAEPYLSLMLKGVKTIESRFSKNRVAPYQQVTAGDVLVLKQPSGPITGLVLADHTQYFQLNSEVLENLRQRYSQQIAATDDQFWQQRSEKQYASLITVTSPTPTAKISVSKQDRRGWVCLSAGFS